MAAKIYYVIYDEVGGGYYDRIKGTFRGIVFATQYQGDSVAEIESVITGDPNIGAGYYVVKRIIEIE